MSRFSFLCNPRSTPAHSGRLVQGRWRLVTYSVNRKLFKYLLIGGVVLLSAFSAVVYLAWHGHIPSFADTEDVSYAKLLGVRPSSGSVWQYATGWGSGLGYYRLHLSRRDLDSRGVSRLTRLPSLPQPKSAPIWWNPSPDSALSFTGGGLGHRTENLYVYDSHRELLFARCEWD